MEFKLREGIHLQKLVLDTMDTAPESMVIAFLTHAGNYYSYNTTIHDLCETEDRIMAELSEKNDTAVCALICFSVSGGMRDIPSSLQKKLIALNEANRSAWQFIPGLRPLENF